MSIAVVTGGAGDIGREICRALGRAGHTIAIVDLSAEKCEAFAAELSGEGVTAFAARADITDARSAASMAEMVLARGAVEVVVNNAGVAYAPDFGTTDEANWEAAIAVNLTAAYRIARLFLPGMQAARRGVVINVSSGNGIIYAGQPAYSVAKAGLIHFTRMLAVEYGRDNIRALSIVPGSVRTQAWAHRAEVNPNIFDDIRRWYPLGRIVEAREVANVVAFAASDAASAMTGSSLVVDCGGLAGNRVMAEEITRGDA